MKKQYWRNALYILFLTGILLAPIPSYAEAEPLYVSGLDLDYAEPNLLLSWIEEIRYKLSEVSPLLSNILDPQNNASEDQFVATPLATPSL